MMPFSDFGDGRALAQAIVDTVREPLLVLDKDLRVVAASRAIGRLSPIMESATATKAGLGTSIVNA